MKARLTSMLHRAMRKVKHSVRLFRRGLLRLSKRRWQVRMDNRLKHIIQSHRLRRTVGAYRHFASTTPTPLFFKCWITVCSTAMRLPSQQKTVSRKKVAKPEVDSVTQQTAQIGSNTELASIAQSAHQLLHTTTATLYQPTALTSTLPLVLVGTPNNMVCTPLLAANIVRPDDDHISLNQAYTLNARHRSQLRANRGILTERTLRVHLTNNGP